MTKRERAMLAELTLSRWCTSNSLEKEIRESNMYNQENPYSATLIRYEEISDSIVDDLVDIVTKEIKRRKEVR